MGHPASYFGKLFINQPVYSCVFYGLLLLVSITFTSITKWEEANNDGVQHDMVLTIIFFAVPILVLLTTLNAFK